MPSPKPVTVEKFLGIVNKPDKLRRPLGSLDHAKNADVDDEGALRKCLGHSLTASFTDIYGAYATLAGDRAFVIDNGALKEIVDTSGTAVTLTTGLSDGDYYWAEAGNRVYFSGPSQGQIEDGVYRSWGVATPPQPTVTTGAGSLPAGRYLVSCTYVDSYGREGGAPAPVVVTLTGDQLLSIGLTDLANHTIRVYVSSTNGRTLYFTEETTTSSTFNGPLTALVSPLRDEQITAEPPPSGEVIAYHDERVYVAQRINEDDLTAIFFSQRWWYHLFHIDQDFLPIPGEVRFMASVSEGLVIATDRSIFVLGANGLSEIADFGVPEGSSYGYDDQRRVVFWTNHGACRALPFEQLTYAHASVHPGIRSCGIVIDKDHQRFVAYLTHSEDPTTWITAE
jgi:hypothetical protein